MRRSLLGFMLLLALLLAAVAQHTTTATPTGGTTDTYMPIVRSFPTPTATLTPTATATPGTGTGIFKKNGDTVYAEQENYTGACGFILFYDGRPAYGGDNGFSAELCMDDHGCSFSAPVDATGYYEIALHDGNILGDGELYVLKGRGRERVSRYYGVDTTQGDSATSTLIRMDFIECRQGDTNNNCTLTAADETRLEAQIAELEKLAGFNDPNSPNFFCPSR